MDFWFGFLLLVQNYSNFEDKANLFHGDKLMDRTKNCSRILANNHKSRFFETVYHRYRKIYIHRYYAVEFLTLYRELDVVPFNNIGPQLASG